MNIILFGFKNCGKGYVGKALAKYLDRDFVDTDDIIEEIYLEKYGQQESFRGIAKKHGMDFFRELEKKATKRVSEQDNKIVAVGGGTPLSSENRVNLKKNGKMILLIVDKEDLFRRIMQKGLPAFFDPNDPRGSFKKLLKERMDLFEKIADVKVNCDNKKREEIAKEITKLVGKD